MGVEALELAKNVSDYNVLKVELMTLASRFGDKKERKKLGMIPRLWPEQLKGWNCGKLR